MRPFHKAVEVRFLHGLTTGTRKKMRLISPTMMSKGRGEVGEVMHLNFAAGTAPRRGEKFVGYDGSWQVSRIFKNRAKRLSYEDSRSL